MTLIGSAKLANISRLCISFVCLLPECHVFFTPHIGEGSLGQGERFAIAPGHHDRYRPGGWLLPGDGVVRDQ